MYVLRLAVPNQTPNHGVIAFLNPSRLRAWLETLPSGDPVKTAQELLKALSQVNRAEVPVVQRYNLMDQCRPLIADILDTLYKQYATAAVPLEEKHRLTAELAHSLLTETICGYKAVVLATSETPTAEATRNMLVASAVYAVHNLARLLVDTYSLYAPEPKTLWLELHQIYRYAEKQGFLAITPRQDGKESQVRTIDHTYRRIIMLALANPYHLMQGETLLVFHELDRWAANCRIVPLAGGVSPNGHLYLDLDRDAPPCYAPVNMKLQAPGDGRILDISSVLLTLEHRTKELLISSRTESGQLNLAGRQLRNMYKRLAESWGVRAERLSKRRQRSSPSPVDIAVGISACHHFASKGAVFNPEISEFELQKSNPGIWGHGLSLTSENNTPWIDEDHVQRLHTGIIQPRTSQFTVDPVKDKDIWVKVYSTQAYHEHRKTSDVGSNQVFESVACQLRDESRGGMAISCKKANGIRLTAGEIIAFKSEHAPTANDWSVGVVRWLRATEQDKLELGIRLLSDDTLPVATRGIKGIGKDTEYFRGLLIPKLDPLQYPATLITPAAVYDVDSVIFVNTGTQIFYAMLTKLVDASNAYCLFQFQIVRSP